MHYKKHLKIIILLIPFVLCISNVKAYDIKDAINIMISKNNQLNIAKRKLEIAFIQKPKVITEFLPNVLIEINKTFYNSQNSTKLSSYDKELLIIALEQEILSGGSTIAKIIASEISLSSVYQEYNKALNNLILKVIELYQKVLCTREMVKIQGKSVDIARKNIEKSKLQVRIGGETKDSIFRAKSELATLESNLESFILQQRQAELYFRYYVGQDAPKLMNSINIRKYSMVATMTILKKLVNSQNSDLIIYHNNLNYSKQSINMATSALLPKISIFVNKLSSHYHNSIDSVKEILNFRNYGIKMQIPLFYKGGVQYLSILEAKKISSKQEAVLKDIISRVQTETHDLWYHHMSEKNMFKIANIAEDNARSSYLSVQDEFIAGAKLITDIIKRQYDYNNCIIARLKQESHYILSLFKIYNLSSTLSGIMNKT